MPLHVDHRSDLYDFTSRLRRWLYSFILKPCTLLVRTFDRNSQFGFTLEGKKDCPLMARAAPIDIISSDSENETEVGGESLTVDAPSIPRKLPSWASTQSIRPNGPNGSSRSQQWSGRASSSASTNDHNPLDYYQKLPGSIYEDNTPYQHIAVAATSNPNLSTAKWNVDQPANGLHIIDLDSRSNFNHIENAGNNYGNTSYQQSARRMLPPSFQPEASTSKAKASMENGGIKISDTRSNPYQALGTNNADHKLYTMNNIGASTDKAKAYIENGGNIKISEIRSKPYLSLGTNTTDHKLYMANNLSGNDEAHMYAPNGSRLLPPSLMHGKLPPSSQSAGPSDPAFRHGTEEGPTDERLVYQAALQDLAQPRVEVDLRDGLLAVPLMKHQKIALAWMCQKETASLPCLGGILADDQGLGKTISMIALILHQRDLQSPPTANDTQTVKAEALNLDDDDDDVSEMKKVTSKAKVPVPEFHKRRPAAGTLVVCPASVLRQWARELDDKVTDSSKLSVLIYHGGTRTKDPYELARHDVVLTTYAIVANEVPKQAVVDDDEDKKDGEKYGLSSEFSNNKKRKKASQSSKKGKKGKKGIDGSSFDCDSGALARVGWFRVILDEAQTIKNHRTQVARACCGLRAKRRWCLSGTPIQNTIDDLFSYFRYLKYDPYSTYKSFCSAIKYPISKHAVYGYKKLQAVLKTIMLRRTKGTLLDGKPIINLPPKTISLLKVDFSIEEMEFYKKLEADSQCQFKKLDEAGTLNKNYANILLMLLRLRQACDHPLLVKGHNSEVVGQASVEMAKRLPRDMLINLLNLLEDPICSLCGDPPEQAVVTMCGHVFCYQCVSDYLTGDENFCPAHDCKQSLGTDVVFAKATLRNCISGDHDDDTSSSLEGVDNFLDMQNMYSSSKIRAALEILERNSNSTLKGAPVKAIVFSQWTGMLDLVETALNHSCIQYRRFDGTMSLAARDRAVKDFNNDPEVIVMLMSLKAGNLGLNMVAACHVIMLDLWWNPTTEDQAVDRAHRIGQTRPVTVSRLTISNTVEDRILALQEKKRAMVASAFGEDQKGGGATKLTMDDLRYLFMA